MILLRVGHLIFDIALYSGPVLNLKKAHTQTSTFIHTHADSYSHSHNHTHSHTHTFTQAYSHKTLHTDYDLSAQVPKVTLGLGGGVEVRVPDGEVEEEEVSGGE